MHKEISAEKQMPLLKALGQVMGVQNQSRAAVVTNGCVGHRVETGSAQGTPQSNTGGGSGNESAVMAELKSMREDIKISSAKLDTKLSKLVSRRQ